MGIRLDSKHGKEHMMYRWEQRVRYSEVNSTGRMSPSALINYFQDCTNLESLDLGVGLDKLREMNLGWIILKWQVTIKRLPKMGEKIYVCTFPYSFKGYFAFRNFLLEDENGEVIAAADSHWMMIDTTLGTTVKIPEVISGAYTLSERYDMENIRSKIVQGENPVTEECIVIGRQNLDTNGHVNNGQYIKMAEGFLPTEKKLSGIRVEYRNQSFLGDRIYPKVSDKEGEFVVSLENAEGSAYAVVSFTTIV